MSEDPVKRCEWALSDPALLAYHDAEWGIPEHDDRKLFEFLVLEGAQAGLSWLPVLKKHAAFRKALHGFGPGRAAEYNLKKGPTPLADAGIIPKRAKNAAAIENAKAFLLVQ